MRPDACPGLDRWLDPPEDEPEPLPEREPEDEEPDMEPDDLVTILGRKIIEAALRRVVEREEIYVWRPIPSARECAERLRKAASSVG